MTTNVPNERPEDETRLLFSVEVFLANIPSIVTDLSSAKYALLILTEKYRNEVKQKGILIPSISGAFHELLDLRSRLQSDQENLSELETQIVTSTTPKFISKKGAYAGGTSRSGYISNDHHMEGMKKCNISEEDRRNKTNELLLETKENDMMLDCNEGAVKYIPHVVDSNHRTVVFLGEKDLQKVQAAELMLEEERNKLALLAKETNSMEDRLDVDRVQCESMAKHVQGLKWDLERACAALMETKNERQQYELFQLEWGERKLIGDVSDKVFQEILGLLYRDELSITTQALDHVRESIVNCRKGLAEKQKKNEVELAVYQIAYKEQQAAAEEVKGTITYLHHHQRELELLAKQQEIEEAKRNSIRQLLMSSLRFSPDRGEVPFEQLQPEHLKEVEEEHQMVTLVATRIAIMEERRREIAAILMRLSPTEKDVAYLESLVEHVKCILQAELVMDEETLRDVESP